MNRNEAIEQYRAALRRGQKYQSTCTARGEDPWPKVLQELVPNFSAASRVDMGIIEIPMDAIVGTLADGRKSAFAGNMMPLLGESTEFAQKWIALCEAHLGDQGITDPITCYEYYGLFYVQEGHKRVSVLRSYDALTIRAHVLRVLPEATEEPQYLSYQEFIRFYSRSRLYVLRFDKPGSLRRLEQGLGMDEDHVWTDEERLSFLALYWKVREACQHPEASGQSPSEALLACLDVYPYDQLLALDTAEIRKRVSALVPDLRYAAADEPKEVSTEPDIPERSLVERIITGITRPVLNVAFIHVNDPNQSVWTRGHEEGRLYVDEALGAQVRTRCYVVGEQDADALMEKAITEDGAALLIATAPTLLASARQAAALHPNVKVLVCALSVPYVGVRTYYSRIHEAKFISGAIAGAMCGKDPVGYIARYPILGVPAAVNAFAQGLRMTNPEAKILLEWSCLGGNPVKRLWADGARIISGHPIPNNSASGISFGWSTALMAEDGSFLPLASDLWDWGKTYEQIVRSVLAGAWDKEASPGTAVSYWWGMSSGVIDVKLAESLPDGVWQLADILKDGLVHGTVQPFTGPIRDQEGILRLPAEGTFTPDELMRMNWLREGIIGSIPKLEELMPAARETTRLLALPEDEGITEPPPETTNTTK
ncbi:MAG: BMP family ABC transporter substrate-binding protein [Clostridia bacterium]|nr:BMP family ABC transporter substrate-binding protein [Clostridia bacterium]